jgi:hypothetical protein
MLNYFIINISYWTQFFPLRARALDLSDSFKLRAEITLFSIKENFQNLTFKGQEYCSWAN